MATCLSCSRRTTEVVCSVCGSRAGVLDWEFHQEADFISRGQFTHSNDGACLGLSMLWILEMKFGHGRGQDFFRRLNVPRWAQNVDRWMGEQKRFLDELIDELEGERSPFPVDNFHDFGHTTTAKERAHLRWALSMEESTLIESWARRYKLLVLDKRIGFAAGRRSQSVWEECGRHGASGPGLRLLAFNGSVGGHAIASYGNASLGILRVFDPNCGQYSFPSATAQAAFVTHLGLQAYEGLSQSWNVYIFA